MFSINVNAERFVHAQKNKPVSWKELMDKVNSEVGIDSGNNDVFDFIEAWDGNPIIDNHDGFVVIGMKIEDKVIFVSCCNNGKGAIEAINAIIDGVYHPKKDVAEWYLKEVLEHI